MGPLQCTYSVDRAIAKHVHPICFESALYQDHSCILDYFFLFPLDGALRRESAAYVVNVRRPATSVECPMSSADNDQRRNGQCPISAVVAISAGDWENFTKAKIESVFFSFLKNLSNAFDLLGIHMSYMLTTT